jgi:hypothetical protein
MRLKHKIEAQPTYGHVRVPRTGAIRRSALDALGATAMKRRLKILPFTLTSYLFLFLSVSLSMPKGAMSQTSPFTAQYQISNVTQASDGKMEMTFSVRLYNNGSSDVNDGTLSVANPAANQKFGSFQNVSVSVDGNTVVSGSLTLPRNIYKLWQNGAFPRLNLDSTDINGNPIHRVFQATAMPGGKSL